MRRALFSAALWCLGLTAACAKAPPSDIAQLDALPPKVPIKLDVVVGAAVELLGAALQPTQGLKVGSRVQLTLYWRRVGPVPRGYRLFTHVLDGAGERLLTLDGNGPLRRLSGSQPVLAPRDWQEGKVYVDQQAFTVPSNLRTDSLMVVTGLFRDDARLPVTRGKHLADRALVATLPVQRPTAMPGAVPVIWVPRLRPDWRLEIDGNLDEKAWSLAATTGQLGNAGTGETQAGSAVTGDVRLLYDDQALYVGFDVYDEDLRGGFDPQQTDPHLWLKDTVELMIDPDGDGDNLDYYEIQVSPQNLVFDSRFDSYNQPRVEPNGPFGHQAWSAGLKSAVVLRGTLDDDVEDEGYVVEMAIPWGAFDKAKRTPPRPDDIWRMNFYVVENNGGAAWSPLLGQGNFHKASRFGRVRFSR